MNNRKERISEQKLAEQFVTEIFESIQYLPESEQEAFLERMNEAGKGNLINKVKAVFGDPKAQIAELTAKLRDIDATFGQIVTAIDEAARLNPAIPAETVEADKAKVGEFQNVFRGLAAEAQEISAAMDVPPAAGAEGTQAEAGEAQEAEAEGTQEAQTEGAQEAEAGETQEAAAQEAQETDAGEDQDAGTAEGEDVGGLSKEEIDELLKMEDPEEAGN